MQVWRLCAGRQVWARRVLVEDQDAGRIGADCWLAMQPPGASSRARMCKAHAPFARRVTQRARDSSPARCAGAIGRGRARHEGRRGREGPGFLI